MPYVAAQAGWYVLLPKTEERDQFGAYAGGHARMGLRGPEYQVLAVHRTPVMAWSTTEGTDHIAWSALGDLVGHDLVFLSPDGWVCAREPVNKILALPLPLAEFTELVVGRWLVGEKQDWCNLSPVVTARHEKT